MSRHHPICAITELRPLKNVARENSIKSEKRKRTRVTSRRPVNPTSYKSTLYNPPSYNLPAPEIIIVKNKTKQLIQHQSSLIQLMITVKFLANEKEKLI